MINQNSTGLIKTKYSRIIVQLQKAFQQKQLKKLQQVFRNNLSRQFKFEVASDSTMEELLKELHQDYVNKYQSTELFSKKIDFLDKINNMLFEIEFISKREYLKLREIISKQKSNPSTRWLEQIGYLRSSDNLQQFRSEFLTRYMNLSQEQVDQILYSENCQKNMKQYYEKFFKNCLTNAAYIKVINYIEDCFSKFENKSEMLSPQLLQKLQKTLGVQIGSDELEIKINKKLVQIAQINSYNNDQQVQQRLEDQIQLIQRALKKFSGLNIFKEKGIQLTLGKFGSIISGFAGIDADLDLTILTNCYVNQIELLRLLNDFLKKQYKNDDGGRGPKRISMQLIISAKTPLVAIKIGERGKSDLKIDLIVNNILGILNSKFLSVYSGVKWIKNLGILVKIWGKSVSLIGKSYLSSYAMILLLIHYLIKSKKAKPILDNRYVTAQTPHFNFKRKKGQQIQQFPVYYRFRDSPKDVSPQQRANYYKILLGFTKYYGYEIWQQTSQANRIITVDQSTQRPIDRQCAITIKDPFDKPHNPGRLKIQSKQFFIQKFKDAYQILENCKQDQIAQLFT